ncbi:MAG: DNA repair exonuclease [Candidatus Thermoplasmatota archaeon]
MKILHVADTHLGYAAYRRTTDEGVNQREQDIYDAFNGFIDQAIKEKPDVILHAGDLFDSVRPNNRAITFALEEMLRLSKLGIPLVIIDGNHEHPKLRETGHIFRIFEHIDHVYPVYNETYRTINIECRGKKIAIHALPHCNSSSRYEQEFKKIKIQDSCDYNILLTHGSVKGVHNYDYSMNEFNELSLSPSLLTPDFDYIALGHYHKHTQIKENAWYSGSIEHLTFTEANDKKGYIKLDEKLKPVFIELETRAMIDTEAIDCTNQGTQWIMKQIEQLLQNIKPSGKIIRINLDNIQTSVYRGIDFKRIKELCKDSLHYEIKPVYNTERYISTTGASRISSLTYEFRRFMDQQNLEEKDKIINLGVEYIERNIDKKEEI